MTGHSLLLVVSEALCLNMESGAVKTVTNGRSQPAVGGQCTHMIRSHTSFFEF